MKKTLAIILLAVNLTACGTYGEPLILGAWFDRIDQCQSRGQANYQYPDWCGRGVYSTNRARIYDNQGRPVGFVK